MELQPLNLYKDTGEQRYIRTEQEALDAESQMEVFCAHLLHLVENNSEREVYSHPSDNLGQYRSDLEKNAELTQLVNQTHRVDDERVMRDPKIFLEDYDYHLMANSHLYHGMIDRLQRKEISLRMKLLDSTEDAVDSIEKWADGIASYVSEWIDYESRDAHEKPEHERDRILRQISRMQKDLSNERELILDGAQELGRARVVSNGNELLSRINQALDVPYEELVKQKADFEDACDLEVSREAGSGFSAPGATSEKTGVLSKFFDMAKSVGFSLSNEVSKRPARSLAAAIGVGVVATTAIAGVGDVLDTYAERAALKKYHDFEVRTDRQVGNYFQSQINEALRSNEDTLTWFNSLHSNDILVNDIMEDAGYAYSHLSNEYVPAAGQDASTTASSPGSPSLQEWRGFYEAAMAQENTENIDDAVEMVRHVYDQHVKASAMCAEDPGSEACAWDFETTGGRLFLADSQSQVAFDLASGEMTAAIADPNAHVSGMSQDTIDVSIDEFFAYVTGDVENKSAFWEIQRNQERLEEIVMDSHWQKPGQPG